MNGTNNARFAQERDVIRWPCPTMMSDLMAVESAPPIPVDADALREDVKSKYREVAIDPHGKYHFHTGRYLAKHLGTMTNLLRRCRTRPWSPLPAWQIRSPSKLWRRESMSSMSDRAVVSILLSQSLRLAPAAK